MIACCKASPCKLSNLQCYFVLGEWVSCSVGTNFTPHIITANAGEVTFTDFLIDFAK